MAAIQDRRLGLDLPYFEIGDQSVSGYGGIKELQLSDHQLLVRFEEARSPADGPLVVEIATTEGVDELAEALAAIFGTRFCRV
jgi:hypothetical protein